MSDDIEERRKMTKKIMTNEVPIYLRSDNDKKVNSALFSTKWICYLDILVQRSHIRDKWLTSSDL